MKTMKNILAEFREYSQKVNSLGKIIESREARKKQLDEDRELFSEISRDSADKIYDWMRDTDGIPYDFEQLFDGAMRTYIPLASEEQRKLSLITNALQDSGWGVPEDTRYDGSIKAFTVNKVKQKLQRLQADGGGEYEVEVDVADLRLVRKTQKVIPAGPRQGQTVEKKEETSMSKAIARLAKSGKIEKGLLDWWQNTQGMYTRDGNHKTIETAFNGDDESSMYSIVLSRHPIDVLRMSDISNIRSCHSEESEYFHCAVAEAKGHGPIAYLVKTEDLENHLYAEASDDSPEDLITRWAQELNQADYLEKVKEKFDLDTPAGRWLYLENWAESRDGQNWLKMAPSRFQMASHPEKFMVSAMKAKARSIGVEMEELRFYYREWFRGEDVSGSGFPDGVTKADYSKALASLHNRDQEDNTLRPISDFDNQELFRDRQRSIQGVGAKARLRLRKFEEPMRYGTFAVPEKRIYGIHVPGFLSAVQKWATTGQQDQFIRDDDDETGQYIGHPRMQDLTRRGGSYGDNKDGEILNDFFRAMSGESDNPDWEEPYDNYSDAYADADDEEDENEALWEEYNNRVDELNSHADSTLEHAYASATLDDYDGAPYVYADGGVRYEIVLPWIDWAEDTDGDYVQLDAKDGEPVLDSVEIPKAWGGDYQRRNAFESAIDDTLPYYPEETEWEIVTRDDKVVLEVTHRIRMEDGHEPDDYDSFIDYIQGELDRNYRENKEKIRRSLVEGEWIGPSDWDNLQDDISEMQETLTNWSVFGVGDDDGEVIFSLRTGGAYPQGRTHMRTGIKWPFSSTSNHGIDTLRGLFGGTVKTFGIERYLDLNSGSPGTVLAKGGVLFKRAFKGLQDAANEYAQRQQSLDFGPEYEEKYEPIEMGKSVGLGLTLIDPSDTYTGSDGSLELGFVMKVRVYSEDRSDEIEAAFNFVRYIDSNMGALKEAVVNAFTNEIASWNEQRKADERAMSDGTSMRQHAKRLRLQWDEAADNGNLTGEAIMILVMWTEQNFEKMETTAERWVATDILRLHLDGPRGIIWDPTVDLPANWTEKVKGKMVNLGATFSQKESYKADYLSGNPAPEVYSQEGDDEPTLQGTQGAPRPAQEAKLKEEIYKRLQKKILKKKVKSHITERLEHQKQLQKQKVRALVKSKLQELDTGYTQRTYKMYMRLAMAKEHGGKRDETENEIRGILNVTTVKIQAGSTRQDGANYYADVMLKFVLLGQQSVTQYIEDTLKPGLRSIEGLQVTRVDQWEEVTGKQLAEYISIPGDVGQDRISPRPTVDQIIQNWSMTGADRANSAIDNELAHQTREVTMMPVEELMGYLSSPGNYFSGTTNEFEDLKQKIIGGYYVEPVMIAVGKNGRAKVIKGDDLILVAKDIGLEELPTEFSLQYQV